MYKPEIFTVLLMKHGTLYVRHQNFQVHIINFQVLTIQTIELITKEFKAKQFSACMSDKAIRPN